jgi:N-glycosylase/DNA lyase
VNRSELRALRSRLERAVADICSDAEVTLLRRTVAPTELSARREVIGCILGSQVAFSVAAMWTQRIADAGLLDDRRWESGNAARYEVDVRDVLDARGTSANGARYRFPRARARQISLTRQALRGKSILAMCTGVNDPHSVRETLVRCLPGIGPKHASMLLRNLGVSFDLAVLDIHVLRYFEVLGVFGPSEAIPGTLARYRAMEEPVIRYAERIGFRAGSVDLAIWATMKASRELGLWAS